MCLFEYIYFARPDSDHQRPARLSGAAAYGRGTGARAPDRRRRGRAGAGLGHPGGDRLSASVSGIPFVEGLIKNRYIGRTFIQPDQRLRDVGVGLKFNPLPEVLRGKRVVLVDDSIVRGTTTQPLVRLLRQAGAEEVHVRIHSPAFRWPVLPRPRRRHAP